MAFSEDWRSKVDTTLGEHTGRLNSQEKKLEKTISTDSFAPVQRIVFSFVSVILLGVLTLIGKVLTNGHTPW